MIFMPCFSAVFFFTYNKVPLPSVSLISVITKNRIFVYLLMLSHTVYFLERILKTFVISYFSAQLFIALLLCAFISAIFHILYIYRFSHSWRAEL